MFYIEHLKARGVRNLEEFSLELNPRLNYFYGFNASGKTSLLETVFLLSRLKSFRSKRIQDVISYTDKSLTVFATGKYSEDEKFSVGIEKAWGFTKIKFNKKIIQTTSEQAIKLPIHIISNDKNLLFSGAPKDKRHWVDWALFYIKKNYLTIWKKYHKALCNRNILLKNIKNNRDYSQLDSWEIQMACEAVKINKTRKKYLTLLQNEIDSVFLKKVLPGGLTVKYTMDDKDENYILELLIRNRKEDLKKGYTSVGPHRADIVFCYDGFNVSKYLSRGQIKLLNAVIVSAQIKLLKNIDKQSIVLVDDIDAELDGASLDKLFKLLIENDTQIFITSLSDKASYMNNCNCGLFHVKQGKIQKTIF